MRTTGWRLAVLQVALLCEFVSGRATAIGATKPASIRLRIAYAAPIGVMAPLWMAAETGALKAEGIDPELVLVDSRAAIAALIAKEIDALEISMPAVIPATIAGGDITMIAGMLNKMIFSFHAAREIKSAEQLRGKIVGSDRPGTPADYGGRTALSLLGLRPDTDVTILRIGGSNLLWPALQTGQVAAATLSPPQSFNADGFGFNRLVTTYHLPYQNVGIVIRKSEVETRTEAWVGLLRALREGIHRWYQDPKFSRDILMKYTKERDSEKLQKTYEFFARQAGFNQDLEVSEPGTQQILNFLGATVLPAAKGASAKQFYDTRILGKLGR